ncbi:hypothetical protein ACLB1G_21850 [Oxalobacteraceae bacterium A2-2]
MLRRVKKEEVQTETWAQPDPLDYCLDAWKTWMYAGGRRNLDVKIMGGLVGDGDGHGGDLHEAQHSHDMRLGAATDAMIESLSRLHAWAIYRSCGIATAWRFPNADLMTTAAEAKVELVQKLRKNSCTGSLF